MPRQRSTDVARSDDCGCHGDSFPLLDTATNEPYSPNIPTANRAHAGAPQPMTVALCQLALAASDAAVTAAEPASRRGQKSADVRRFYRALFRTRTGDPLERLRQPVAAGGNGFRLFLRFRGRADLLLIATGCNHGAP